MDAKEFNEYAYKNRGERIRVRFLRDSSERLNPWEITNFVSRVSTYMYKIEVLNTIALAVNRGVAKKDIFIMDKAYRLNGNYSRLSVIDLGTSAINRIYAMGKPVGMEPNDGLIEMRFLFELLYEVNTILYRLGKRRIGQWVRPEAYNVMSRDGFPKAAEFVLESATQGMNREEYLGTCKKIDRACEKILKEYEGYLSDRIYFEAIEEKQNKHGQTDYSETEQRIKRSYYGSFYEYLHILPRPIVGIYDGYWVRILCADHFDGSINRNSKIDLKSVTQNSPIMAEIEAGCQILALRKEEKRRAELHELEKKKLDLEIRLMEQEAVKNELDIINSVIELKTRLHTMAETEENMGIKGMADSYANRQLLSVYNKVQKGYSEALKTNRFVEESNAIIDLKA